MLQFIFTTVVFFCALVFVPLLAFSYLGVKIFHYIWFNAACFLHPNLQFIEGTTLRTLADTHRNQGIVAVLLSVKGSVNLDAVGRHLQEIIERTDKLGNLAFPRLQQSLVTKLGTYAWQSVKFDLTQNLILAPPTFRGRAVSEYNIQDCVSEIVSKYIPVGIPPWQIILIPSSEHQHYILLKVHHVLLSDGLGLSDLLPISPPNRPNLEIPRSKLRNVFQQPKSIPSLFDRLYEDFTNRWNEFISNYDPLECPELTKTIPGFTTYIFMMVIAWVSICKEFRKSLNVVKSDPISRFKFFFTTADRDFEKRGLNVSNLVKSFFVTIDPRNVIACVVGGCWRILLYFIKLPLRIYTELLAFHSCLTLQYCAYPNTTVGFIYNYVPLFYYSFKEFLYCLKILWRTPKNILEELWEKKETIQTVTLCGRKVVSWSEPVKTEWIKKIASCTGVSESEIFMSAVSCGIARYLGQIKETGPNKITITTRNINSDYIFASGKCPNAIGGMLCVDLPILAERSREGLLENLTEIKKNLAKALNKQEFTYFLSLLQTRHATLSKFLPATLVGIFLRCLSFKYSVTFTEILSRYPNISQKTIWGQEVNSAVYWRPPQANISISLCVNQYGDHTILGVMCDAQLAPHHPSLARGFLQDLTQLAAAAGVEN